MSPHFLWARYPGLNHSELHGDALVDRAGGLQMVHPKNRRCREEPRRRRLFLSSRQGQPVDGKTALPTSPPSWVLGVNPIQRPGSGSPEEPKHRRCRARPRRRRLFLSSRRAQPVDAKTYLPTSEPSWVLGVNPIQSSSRKCQTPGSAPSGAGTTRHHCSTPSSKAASCSSKIAPSLSPPGNSWGGQPRAISSLMRNPHPRRSRADIAGSSQRSEERRLALTGEDGGVVLRRAQDERICGGKRRHLRHERRLLWRKANRPCCRFLRCRKMGSHEATKRPRSRRSRLQIQTFRLAQQMR